MTRGITKLAIAFVTLLCFAVPGSAQTEVAPDHFDEPSQRAMAKTSPQQPSVQAQVAEQQQILESCYAQINTKSKAVEAIRQDLITNGNEAGQAEALQIYQNELERLQKALAPKISSAQTTLALLQPPQPSPAAHAAKKTRRSAARALPAGLRQKAHPGTALRAATHVRQ
ncbi:MAG TPA: hypothetical protein VEW69_03930 [Alphaproteobacteria bacterium]|nr:hypothetical protein [Alphaproteobacteria bacterium]